MKKEFLILFVVLFLSSAFLVCGYCDSIHYENETSRKTSQTFSYYDTPGKKGWWWYEVKEKSPYEDLTPKVAPQTSPEVEKRTQEVQEEKKKEPVMKTESEEEIKPLEEYSYEELLYMHPEKFRKIYNHYLEKAVANPTEQNLFYYFNLLDVARKKAALFASVYSYVAQKYAQYLPTTAYPISVPGIETRVSMQMREIESYVLGKRDVYGLILFVKRGCPYCEAQKNIIGPLIAKGVNVKIVDITERPDIQQKFGIEMVPTIILVHRNGNFMTITSGVTSLDSIEYAISKGLQILEGESPGRYGIYEFQKGTPLDPYEPPPLWRNKNKSAGGEK